MYPPQSDHYCRHKSAQVRVCFCVVQQVCLDPMVRPRGHFQTQAQPALPQYDNIRVLIFVPRREIHRHKMRLQFKLKREGVNRNYGPAMLCV